MSDTTTATSSKRTYTVLKRDVAEAEDAVGLRATLWIELGSYEAGSEAQALALAIQTEAEADRGGTYVAQARWSPKTAAVKPVTQTKLEWS